MMLTSQQKIELTIRAAMLAKSVLDLTTAQSVEVAKLQLAQIVRDLRGVDECIKKASA